MTRFAKALALFRDALLAPRHRGQAVPLYSLMHRPAAVVRHDPTRR